jgi:oligopeptide transport system ATP-binding protein
MKNILQIENLTVSFPLEKDFLGRTKKKIMALRKINLHLKEGETMGIVGESGCGKTTLAKAIVGLHEIETGSIIFAEQYKIQKSTKYEDWKKIRKDMQFIFQDPVSSLDPMLRIGDILLEPVHIFFPELSYEEKQKKILDMLKKVGLNEMILYRFPHELSGGQCQRIGIARALITNPKFLICDESISSLDLSVQAQILNLWKKLQKEMNLSMIFITHNLSVVRYIADRVTVMYLGEIVEQSLCNRIFSHQYHPYTKALFDSIPSLSPTKNFFENDALKGDMPSPENPPSGCSFRTRCRFFKTKCIDHKPALENFEESNRSVACHYQLEPKSSED